MKKKNKISKLLKKKIPLLVGSVTDKVDPWKHVAITYDRKSFKYYENGKLVKKPPSMSISFWMTSKHMSDLTVRKKKRKKK